MKMQEKPRLSILEKGIEYLKLDVKLPVTTLKKNESQTSVRSKCSSNLENENLPSFPTVTQKNREKRDAFVRERDLLRDWARRHLDK